MGKVREDRNANLCGNLAALQGAGVCAQDSSRHQQPRTCVISVVYSTCGLGGLVELVRRVATPALHISVTTLSFVPALGF